MLYTLITLCLFGGVYAQVPGFGGCPEVQTVADFDSSQYLGRWYEVQKYFAAFEIGGKCITADYSAGENGTIKVVNTQISSFTGQTSSVDGSARVPDPNEPAKLKVKFSSVPFGIEGDYWVLGTDYKTYSVVYSCSDVHQLLNAKFAWILTRDRNPPQSVIDAALKVASDNKVDNSIFMKTDQTNCTEN